MGNNIRVLARWVRQHRLIWQCKFHHLPDVDHGIVPVVTFFFGSRDDVKLGGLRRGGVCQGGKGGCEEVTKCQKL